MNDKRAWSDFPGHVFVLLGNVEHGIDLPIAEKLAHDLQNAIEDAKRTPFDRWFGSLQSGHGEENRRLIFRAGMMPITRDEAEKLFNEIRAVC